VISYKSMTTNVISENMHHAIMWRLFMLRWQNWNIIWSRLMSVPKLESALVALVSFALRIVHWEDGVTNVRGCLHTKKRYPSWRLNSGEVRGGGGGRSWTQ
jgi:hypothetical protein